MALFTMSATSNVKQQNQREHEKEAIFRGEQVATPFDRTPKPGRQGVNSCLPTWIQLLKYPAAWQNKRLQILRTAAAKDPLSSSGE